MAHKPFKDLVSLFWRRFGENEALPEGSSFDVNTWQILGFLATPGFFIAMYLAPTYTAVALHDRPDYQWELRADRLFFSAFAFAATGFATVFHWDMLFPDRHDFLALGVLPLRMRDIFAAKLAALGMFLAAVTAAVNVFSLVLMPLLALNLPELRSAGMAHVIAAQGVSTVGPSVFVFFAVTALQGMLINVLSPRAFRTASPFIQLGLMSVMVMSLLLFPLYSRAIRPLTQYHSGWLYFFPPYWFAGAYELFVPGPEALFVSAGRFAMKATAFALLVSLAAWAAGYKRHLRRTLEADDIGVRRRDWFALEKLLPSPAERAVFSFAARTLARSVKHRLFLATYLSVGLSFGILTLVTLTHGVPGISRDGARSFPLLMLFFVVSGMRAGFRFPAQLGANWLFRIAEANYVDAAVRAARKCVLVFGVLPAVLFFLPLEMLYWGPAAGLFHAVFEMASGALLIEVLFWNFDRVPFTCSYFPGKTNLALLGAAYLYGFTSYAFRMADLEAWLDGSPLRAIVFVGGMITLLALAGRRKARSAALLFDASEPAIESLHLS